MTFPAETRRTRAFATAKVAAVLLACAWASAAHGQQRFKSPEDAAVALVQATKAGDPKAIARILGPGGEDIASSGDAVADAAMRQRFASAYDTKHSIVSKDDHTAIMEIGNEDFPFPIPLVRKGEDWRFDTAAGRQEILYRRIGRNELNAIQACLAYVDAQREYAGYDRTGTGAGVYAQRIISHDGKKDGLYWPSGQGEPESPLGEFVARAAAQGYKGGARAPYHGYFYRILTRQGANAPGGELDYVVRGKMIGGFALVAYPAEYGNSGVMTFVVNHRGTVYEKDLGPRTEAIAGHILSFNPDQTWKKADAMPH